MTVQPYTEGLTCSEPDCMPRVVSVPSGQHFRCGCGKTVMQKPPAPDPNAGLKQLLDVLREYRVVEFKQDTVALRFAADAFNTANIDSKADPGACKCGHDPTEHNEFGECFKGCDVLVCHPKQEATA